MKYYLVYVEIIQMKIKNNIYYNEIILYLPIIFGGILMNDNTTTLSLRIDKELKKQLKLMSIYEEMTVTDIVMGFINYGLQVYETEQRLINKE